MSEITALTLNPKEERRILRGHLWAYRNELKSSVTLQDGVLVDLFSSERRFVARGFYQARGGIAVRVLDYHQSTIDRAFWAARIASAHALRTKLFPDSTAWRWIHGESDGLPGLVADRYGSVVSVQSQCMYYIAHWEILAALFLEVEGITGVYLNLNNRTEEAGEIPPLVTCDLEGLRVQFDIREAQKTGLFLDQRLNRLAVAPFAKGARVLDGHCHLGLWSCHAAQAGAVEIVGVDTSEKALEHARETARLNGLEGRCDFRAQPVEQALEEDREWDIIILDPPALAKARKDTKAALGLYQALNKMALERLEPGGILATSSCSHFVTTEDFHETIKRAASAAHKHVRVLQWRSAGPDHPVLLAMPETAYLKCALLQVVE
ncbi:MAG: class I SAM-dependent rRNA methyltransferase [Candidatus Hydrogenedentes bacterium]|nr:class I SAM-dependent rRNA methyltransferase [Candidatus Hydrogenedentota bacterium]